MTMQTITSVQEMQSLGNDWRTKGILVALVPTMGCLHEGHLKLIREAREQADKVVVSIFVNPTQFGLNEDFEQYPRPIDQDLITCEKEGVDVVFAPRKEDVYPEGHSTFVVEEALSKGLCGISRPNHFRGVLTVVAKLFNLVVPDKAYFGQKDAQQVAVIRRMVRDLFFCIDIEVVPTVREDDGLAMSSRNRYLTTHQREDALVIHTALQKAREMVDSGMRKTDRVIAEVTHMLGTKRRVRIIYVSLVDKDTLEPLREIEPGRSLLAVAVWVDEVRLIDNIIL